MTDFISKVFDMSIAPIKNQRNVESSESRVKENK